MEIKVTLENLTPVIADAIAKTTYPVHAFDAGNYPVHFFVNVPQATCWRVFNSDVPVVLKNIIIQLLK